MAAGAAGTSVHTIGLAAVWAGTAAGALIILAAVSLTARPLRAGVPPDIARQIWLRALRPTVGWALGAYVFWFLFIEPPLANVGIKVPMFG